jgi:hypothetical protein
VAKPTNIAQYSEFLCERLAYWKHPQQRELVFDTKDEASKPSL